MLTVFRFIAVRVNAEMRVGIFFARKGGLVAHDARVVGKQRNALSRKIAREGVCQCEWGSWHAIFEHGDEPRKREKEIR